MLRIFVKIGSLVLADGVTSCIQCFNCPGNKWIDKLLLIKYWCLLFFLLFLEQFEEGTKGQSCGSGLDTCMVIFY